MYAMYNNILKYMYTKHESWAFIYRVALVVIQLCLEATGKAGRHSHQMIHIQVLRINQESLENQLASKAQDQFETC